MNDFLSADKRTGARQKVRPMEPLRLPRGLEITILEHLQFLQGFLREPAITGALTPSSRFLAQAMVAACALDQAKMVVELGPGTGAFTSLILDRIGKGTEFFAMELDPSYARSLRRRFPGLLVYNESAERICEYLALHGRRSANYIVSGIPWANVSPAEQSRIIQGIVRSLSPEGVFTTFAYLHARWLPKARRFRQTLKQNFDRVEASPIVWRNLPPAFVYRCMGPRTGDRLLPRP